MTSLAAVPQPGDCSWMCGAFQPPPPFGQKPYRCTEPYDHPSSHRAVIDGKTVAEWPRRKP